MRPMDDEELSLSVAVARELPEADLRERFFVLALDLVGTFGNALLAISQGTREQCPGHRSSPR